MDVELTQEEFQHLRRRDPDGCHLAVRRERPVDHVLIGHLVDPRYDLEKMSGEVQLQVDDDVLEDSELIQPARCIILGYVMDAFHREIIGYMSVGDLAAVVSPFTATKFFWDGRRGHEG